jgi:hypothetical protein
MHLYTQPFGAEKKNVFFDRSAAHGAVPLRRLFHNGVYNLTNTVSGITQQQRDKQQNANYVCFMYVL